MKLLLLWLVAGSLVFAQYQTPTKVQSKTGTSSGGATTSLTFDSTPSVGNYVLAYLVADPFGPITSMAVTDTASNTYSAANDALIHSNLHMYLQYSKVVSTTGTFTVTFTSTGSNLANSLIVIQEYSGLASSSPLLTSDKLEDGVNVNGTANTTPALSPSCPSGGTCLYVSVVGTSATTTITQTGTGWTQDHNAVPGLGIAVAHKVTTGSQTNSWDFDVFPNAYSGSIIAAFAPAASGGSGVRKRSVVTQ